MKQTATEIVYDMLYNTDPDAFQTFERMAAGEAVSLSEIAAEIKATIVWFLSTPFGEDYSFTADEPDYDALAVQQAEWFKEALA